MSEFSMSTKFRPKKTTSASDVLMFEQLRNWISFGMNKVFIYLLTYLL